MWIFTKWGFLSIVQHNTIPGYFQVKARVIDPLERLWPQHEIEVIHWADYRFRITIEKENVFEIVSTDLLQIYPKMLLLLGSHSPSILPLYIGLNFVG